MKTIRIAIAALFLASCDFDVSNLNAPSIDTLQKPTPSQVNALATGLLIGARKGATERVGYVVEWGILGREAVVLTSSEPRFISLLLQGTLSNGDANFGGNFWVIPYANIRGANLLLHALDNPALTGMTTEQKEAMRGFAKTIQALDYLQVADAHDASPASCASVAPNPCGIVRDVDRPLNAAPDGYASNNDAIYTFIEGLLDDAQTHLAAGGTAFPFKLGSGFEGFDTPATFVKFNRALRARVAVYHGKFADALTALAASFIDDTRCDSTRAECATSLQTGVFHAFSGASGDLANDLNDTSIFAHDSTVTDAETVSRGGCGGPTPIPFDCRDLRVQAKVKAVSTGAFSNHTASYAFTIYPDSASKIPIIRNEELILLRAEANVGLNKLNGNGEALDDINFIRQNSGGLTRHAPFASQAEALDELLNQKRYSLLFEGGHRWIDLRRYGKLDATHVVVDAGDVIHPAFPVPLSETQGH